MLTILGDTAEDSGEKEKVKMGGNKFDKEK